MFVAFLENLNIICISTYVEIQLRPKIKVFGLIMDTLSLGLNANYRSWQDRLAINANYLIRIN